MNEHPVKGETRDPAARREGKSRGICYCLRLQRVEWKSQEVAARAGKIWKLLKYKINHLRPNGEERGPGEINIPVTALSGGWVQTQRQFHQFPTPLPQLDEVRVFAGRNLSPVPADTKADGKVSPTARTQWLLVLPSTELNVRFRLNVLCKGKEPWRLYNANGYSIHIHFLPPGSWRKLASWSTEGLNKELQHPVVLTCAIPIWITLQM